MQEQLIQLFEKRFGEKPDSFVELPISGSARKYFRMSGGKRKVIGAFYTERKENEAFISFSKHFSSIGLNVPEIYAENLDESCYLLQDLGDETLLSFLEKDPREYDIIEEYKVIVEHLAEFQIRGAKGLDYTKCIPRERFDKASMLWDLNYFKYMYLKLAHVSFDEQALENDFERFVDFLAEADSDYFLFRDFQSRNIMLNSGSIYFIDYQGGRKGALAYDLASLLWDAKADLSDETRSIVMQHYLNHIATKYEIDAQSVEKYYSGFALIRILQALGAFGYRGLYERKTHFIKSIPYALYNIRKLLPDLGFLSAMPELKRVLESLEADDELRSTLKKLKLTVQIKSFSYRRGIPYDASGNGGGFVFDCRLIHNPGRIENLKHFTGKDQEIINFIESNPESSFFFNSVKSILKQAVDSYVKREHTHLTVAFGCTGGRHRSVFFAEKAAKFLQIDGRINVELVHTEIE